MDEKKGTTYLSMEDVQEICGIKSNKAYKIIHTLNLELAKMGKITIAGKIPRRFFEEKFYL